MDIDDNVYVRRVDELLTDIDADDAINDVDYVELMDEIASLASSRARAKREELAREERGE